jgi:hypothetical protein
MPYDVIYDVYKQNDVRKITSTLNVVQEIFKKESLFLLDVRMGKDIIVLLVMINN